MHLVALFCHSNDVFIGAHIENIEKFKKCMFRIMNMLLTLILRWKLCYLGLASISTMRCGIYEDAMKEYGLGPNNEILQAAVRNQSEHTGHSLEFHPAERVGLVSVVFVVWLRKLFIYSPLAKKAVNFIVNLTSSCMILMMIVSWWLDIMQDVKRRGWRNMTVLCQDFAMQFTRHWSKDLMMSSLY